MPENRDFETWKTVQNKCREVNCVSEEKINYGSMTVEELEMLLTPKERRFVWEYEVDWNQTRAALRAGYGKTERSAAVTASRLMRKAKIAAYARARQREQYKALNLSRESLSVKLVRVLDQCMEGTEHLSWNSVTKEYEPDGTFVFDSKGATNALKLLGDSIGMYTQNVKHTGNIGIEQFLEQQEQEEADEF